jgi:hypothetical protein
MLFLDNVKVARCAEMGGYLLSDSQKHSLNNRVPVKISKEILDRIKKSTDDYLNNNDYLTIEL